MNVVGLIDKRSHSNNYDMGRWMVESLEKLMVTHESTFVVIWMQETIFKIVINNCSYCLQRQFC